MNAPQKPMALAPDRAIAAQPWRLPSGGLIDRSRALAFTFDGRRLTGHPGDTLASALLANGVRLVGRSFKYHRPRGILSAGSEEPNALVELRNGGSRTRARRRPSCSRDSLRAARTAGPPSPSTSARPIRCSGR
jgi:hypothetical protein